MILDAELRFSNEQALTATADSTNVIDFNQARDMAIGDKPKLKVGIFSDVAFQSTGSSTLVVAIHGSTDNSSYTLMVAAPAIAKASLVAGAQYFIDVPRPVIGQAIPRYLKLVYTVGVADFTTGKVTAFILGDEQANIAYPAGINITV